MEFGKWITALSLDNLLASGAPLAHRDTDKGCPIAQVLRVNHPGLGHKWLHTFSFSGFMSLKRGLKIVDSECSIWQTSFEEHCGPTGVLIRMF